MLYSVFWLIALAIKVFFDYYSLVQPLVIPTRKQMQVDLYCYHYNNLYGDCHLDMVDWLAPKNNDELPADHRMFWASRSYVRIVRWLRIPLRAPVFSTI